jgi:hypothetical protein
MYKVRYCHGSEHYDHSRKKRDAMWMDTNTTEGPAASIFRDIIQWRQEAHLKCR